MQLCDTNVIAELARPTPNRGVRDWADKTPKIILSAITVDEIHYGLAWRPIQRILDWLDQFLATHSEILPVTEEIARVAGQLRGTFQARGKTRSQADMLIGATAKVHGLTLVTRNLRDFEGCGIVLLDPFD